MSTLPNGMPFSVPSCAALDCVTLMSPDFSCRFGPRIGNVPVHAEAPVDVQQFETRCALMKRVVELRIPQVVEQIAAHDPLAGRDLAVGQPPVAFGRIAIGPQPAHIGRQQTVAILRQRQKQVPLSHRPLLHVLLDAVRRAGLWGKTSQLERIMKSVRGRYHCCRCRCPCFRWQCHLHRQLHNRHPCYRLPRCC
jgi:hypothetical protein